MELTVLYEDKELIVCEKPAGVPSQSDRSQAMDMVSLIKNYLRERNPQGGVPYVAVVHRLDRPVGGLMVYAKTPAAAAGLSRQIQRGQLEKEYLAVVCGDFSTELGRPPVELCDYLEKDGKRNLALFREEKTPQAKEARLAYQVLGVKDREAPLSLVQVKLFTGRHHQIRAQLSRHLAGIWGDTKYNKNYKRETGFQELALYAFRLSFRHPKTGVELRFEKKPQKYPFCEF